jgi:hypothetical protein
MPAGKRCSASYAVKTQQSSDTIVWALVVSLQEDAPWRNQEWLNHHDSSKP